MHLLVGAHAISRWTSRPPPPGGRRCPPSKGGHLVLAVAADAEGVKLNKPSGFPGRSQHQAPVPWKTLERFYAGRGVVLGKQEEGRSGANALGLEAVARELSKI